MYYCTSKSSSVDNKFNTRGVSLRRPGICQQSLRSVFVCYYLLLLSEKCLHTLSTSISLCFGLQSSWAAARRPLPDRVVLPFLGMNIKLQSIIYCCCCQCRISLYLFMIHVYLLLSILLYYSLLLYTAIIYIISIIIRKLSYFVLLGKGYMMMI